MAETILIVDDQETTRHFLSKALAEEGYSVVSADTGQAGLARAKEEDPDLVLLDLRLPDMTGLNVLEQMREQGSSACVIIMTAYGDVESAVGAMRLGACDFIVKPVNLRQIALVVKREMERHALERELLHRRKTARDKFSSEYVMGESQSIKRVYQIAEQVAKTDTTSVLIEGESGTGKELVAHYIHEMSSRWDRPFLDINCAAIPTELLESELFGHEKGAFTDARFQKQGLLEVANGGTLFLDEVGEMGLPVQVKLLRVLERMTFKRVGGTKDVTVSVRIISATNRDLEKSVREGAFREDLYYRLKVLPICVPPLRERREDIVPLARHFMSHFNKVFHKNFVRMSPEAEQALTNYEWPGNIRQLKNLFERIILLESGETLEARHVQLTGGRVTAGALSCLDLVQSVLTGGEIPRDGLALESVVQEIEKALIVRASEICGWNQTKAAELLGIKRDKLRYRMKLYGLKEAVDEAQVSREDEEPARVA
ncbi:MAG: sigma-54-dependent Fis family transcriptional regulator [Candidatus Eisenbacteria bacterium]|nr:sigma-54-dependent Fis family transcriptional regulator [Candidatus Eisenbacteria bacterium]